MIGVVTSLTPEGTANLCADWSGQDVMVATCGASVHTRGHETLERSPPGANGRKTPFVLMRRAAVILFAAIVTMVPPPSRATDGAPAESSWGWRAGLRPSYLSVVSGDKRDGLGSIADLDGVFEAYNFKGVALGLDASVGRVPAGRVFHRTDLRGGLRFDFPGHMLSVSGGASVDGIQGMVPPALGLLADVSWRVFPTLPRPGPNLNPWSPTVPVKAHGVGFQVGARGEWVVVGRDRELLWTARAELVWFQALDWHSVGRVEITLGGEAATLAGATYGGGSLGIAFGRSPVVVVAE